MIVLFHFSSSIGNTEQREKRCNYLEINQDLIEDTDVLIAKFFFFFIN